MADEETVSSSTPEGEDLHAEIKALVSSFKEREESRKAAEEKALKADRLRIAVYSRDTEADENTEVRRELDGSLGITKDYGDLHFCTDPDCQNKAHGLRFARVLRSMKRFGDITKTTSGLIEGSGGQEATYLVPVIYQQDLIPLLRARVVVRQTGTRVIPMTEASLKMPAQTAAATAYWSGEVAALDASNPTFAQLTFNAKDLLALTYFSNDLLMDSHPAVDAVVRDDLVAILARAEDKGFLLGGANISSNAPTGIYSNTAANTYAVQTGIGSASPSEVALGGASVTYDNLVTAYYNLLNANIPMESVAWVTDPYVLQKLMQTTDSTGEPIFRPNFALGGDIPIAQNSRSNPVGRLLGFPVFTTTQMPSDDSKGGSNNGHAMILGDWNEAAIGDRQQVEVAMSNQAMILGTDASAYSLFSNNASAIRVVERVDFQLFHPTAFCVISGIV